jgi:signal transduction histidine kinase
VVVVGNESECEAVFLGCSCLSNEFFRGELFAGELITELDSLILHHKDYVLLLASDDNCDILGWPKCMLAQSSSYMGGFQSAQPIPAKSVGLAVVLLVSSGLLLRSFAKMLEVDPGFEPSHVLTASLSLPTHGELRQKRRDGVRITVASRCTTLRDNQGKAMGWLEINTDITARQRAEVAARSLSRRILSLEADERRRIARELHDSLGQYLTSLKIIPINENGEK